MSEAGDRNFFRNHCSLFYVCTVQISNSSLPLVIAGPTPVKQLQNRKTRNLWKVLPETISQIGFTINFEVGQVIMSLLNMRRLPRGIRTRLGVPTHI